MDPGATGMPADAPGTAPPYVSPSAAFPIAIVIAMGFMVTSLILVSYYLLVVRCWLRANGASLLPRTRRDQLADRVSAVFFTDHDADGLPGGVDPDVVAALPVVAYRPAAKKALECAVCLSDFAPGERLKMLPACSHVFHIDCIDTWLHHNVSCPLCRTEVTGPAPAAVVDDDHDEIAARDRRIHAAHSTYAGGSCRFPNPKQGVAVQEPIRRSLSMDFFPGDRGGRKPTKEAQLPSHADVAGSSSSMAATNPAGIGETSGRFRRLLSSFGLGRSSRSTVLPIHLDP